MNKQLILLRHGKAGWEEGRSGIDIDKPLTLYGITAIRALGKRLRKRKLTLDALLCSPANRAQMTAELIAEELNYPLKNIRIERNIYDNTIDDLFSVLASCDQRWKTILLVGHNPSLSEFATDYSNTSIHFSTGALYELTFPINDWAEIAPQTGKCTFYDITDD